MTLKQAIEKAQEYGFVMNGSRYSSSHLNIQIVLLDPSFWQCLGKAMGWYAGEYTQKAQDMIYQIFSENKSIEKYFESLTP